MKCNCEDFKLGAEAHTHIYETLFEIARLVGKYDYNPPIKKFVFCPWCGEKLYDPTTKENNGGLDNNRDYNNHMYPIHNTERTGVEDEDNL